MKKTVQTKLDEKDIEKISKKAKEYGHTLSSFIRFIVKLFLNSDK